MLHHGDPVNIQGGKVSLMKAIDLLTPAHRRKNGAPSAAACHTETSHTEQDSRLNVSIGLRQHALAYTIPVHVALIRCDAQINVVLRHGM